MPKLKPQTMTTMEPSQQNSQVMQQSLFAGMDVPMLRSRDPKEREQYALDILTGKKRLSYSPFYKFMASPDAFIRNRRQKVIWDSDHLRSAGLITRLL